MDKFDERWGGKNLPDERLPPLIKLIHKETKYQIYEYLDLAGVAGRLKAFVGEKTPEEPVKPNKETEFAFLQKGNGWELVWEGKGTWLKDMKGLRYISQLIRDPGHFFICLGLVRAVEGLPAASQDVGYEDGEIKGISKAIPGCARRARNAVSSAIDYSLRKIEKELPNLWLHLDNSIRRKGNKVSYCPDKPPAWKI